MKLSTLESVVNNYWFLASIRTSSEVSVIIDDQFRYIAVSSGICKLLNKQRSQLEGKIMTELYPEIVNFKNYENLKRALQGDEFVDTVPAITGDMFEIEYRPIRHNGKILGVHTLCKAV